MWIINGYQDVVGKRGAEKMRKRGLTTVSPSRIRCEQLKV